MAFIDKINEFTVQELIDMSKFHETKFNEIEYDLFLMHIYERILLWSFSKFIFPNNANYLEIGTYAGISALLIKETNPTIDVTCVDPYFPNAELENRLKYSMDELYYKTLTQISKTDGYPNGIRLIRGDSKRIIPMFKDDYFDVVFIDGDHSYESVRQDIIQSYPKIKNNGIIFGHDSNHTMVYDAITKYIVPEINLKNIPNMKNPYILKFKDIVHNVIGMSTDLTNCQINDLWFARVVKEY
jgi:hypothetical protein